MLTSCAGAQPHARKVDETRMRMTEEERVERAAQLQRTMGLLVHASGCANPQCPSSNCQKVGRPSPSPLPPENAQILRNYSAAHPGCANPQCPSSSCQRSDANPPACGHPRYVHTAQFFLTHSVPQRGSALLACTKT